MQAGLRDALFVLRCTLAAAAAYLIALWLGLDPRIITVQALTCTVIGAWLVTRPEA